MIYFPFFFLGTVEHKMFSVAELSIEEENPAVKQQDFTVNVLPGGHS